MPALNQNIVIFDHDAITIRFNVSDTENNLNQAAARAWWGVADDASDTGTLYIEKSSGNWSNGTPSQGSTVPTGNAQQLQLGAVFLNCRITGSDWPGQSYTSTQTWYHELVYSGNGDQTNTNVVAEGVFELRPSLFTLKGYR